MTGARRTGLSCAVWVAELALAEFVWLSVVAKDVGLDAAFWPGSASVSAFSPAPALTASPSSSDFVSASSVIAVSAAKSVVGAA